MVMRRTCDGLTRNCGSAEFSSFPLIAVLTLALAGCAVAERAPDVAPAPLPAPPVVIPEITWWQIDGDIGAASLAAAGTAKQHARGAMEGWRSRIDERIEADFIPWLTAYWTQQWLTIKMAWFKLSEREGSDAAVERLAAHLQDQYRERVLAPVAAEVDPDAVREQATKRYVRLLGEALQGVRRRYGVPREQFDRRLDSIPAIALVSPAAPDAWLRQLIYADPLDRLPAYAALIDRIRGDAGRAGVATQGSRISPIARRAGDALAGRIAASGGASAAAAAFGGVAGVMISLVAAGVGAIAHEEERPRMEARLRQDLDAAVNDMGLDLVEDPDTGVMAGVHHISRQIDGSLARTLTQPIELEPPPHEVELPPEQAPANAEADDEAEAEDGYADDPGRTPR